MRLELLEGVGAFHAGDNAKAKAALEGALAKWERLQVSDDRLAELLAMGFTSSEVCSFLRHLQHPFALLPLGICWQIYNQVYQCSTRPGTASQQGQVLLKWHYPERSISAGPAVIILLLSSA